MVGTANDAEGRIVVSVQDSGMGITAEALPRMFRAFEQADMQVWHRYGGMGLGLAISEAIVHSHRGTIRTESPGPGQGATFTVTLDTIEPVVPCIGNAPAATPVLRPLRLLVAEDHETTRNVLVNLLTRLGHTAYAAGIVRGALDLAASHDCDLLISDLGLPDGSGCDLMRELRRTHGCPGIALTGFGCDKAERDSLAAGFHAHLVKPVEMDALLRVIRETCEGELSAPGV